MARLLDAAREFLGPVQKIERGEIVAAADIVFPALAGPKQNTAVVAGRRLAGLHIEMIGMQRDFTRDGDAALIGAKIVSARHKTEPVARCRADVVCDCERRASPRRRRKPAIGNRRRRLCWTWLGLQERMAGKPSSALSLIRRTRPRRPLPLL